MLNAYLCGNLGKTSVDFLYVRINLLIEWSWTLAINRILVFILHLIWIFYVEYENCPPPFLPLLIDVIVERQLDVFHIENVRNLNLKHLEQLSVIIF